MNSKDFILINLNQNISKARKAASKLEKNRWIIFGLICTLFLSNIGFFIWINYSTNELIESRNQTIDKIKLDTENLKKDAKIKLSKAEIISSYNLGKQYVPWSRKLTQLSEMTPHNMCITKLVLAYDELRISAISRIEDKNQKDMAVCNKFIKTLESDEDFYKEFDKIKFSKSKRIQSNKRSYLSFEITAKLKNKIANRLDDIVINKEIFQKSNQTQTVKKESSKKDPPLSNLSDKKDNTNVKKQKKIKEKKNTKDIVEKEDEVHSETWSILELPIISYFANYFKSENENIDSEDSDEISIVASTTSNEKVYSKEIIELAKSINTGNPDSKSVAKLQKLLNMYNERDAMFGILDSKTILAISTILNKKSKTPWEKKYEDVNKSLAGIEEKSEIHVQSEDNVTYNKLITTLAVAILDGNPNEPDKILVQKFQEAAGICQEGETGYGKFNAETVDLWAKVLGVK